MAATSASEITPSRSTSKASNALTMSLRRTFIRPHAMSAPKNSQKCNRPSPVKSRAEISSRMRRAESLSRGDIAAELAPPVWASGEQSEPAEPVSMSSLDGRVVEERDLMSDSTSKSDLAKHSATSSSRYTAPRGVAALAPSKEKKMSRHSVHNSGGRWIRWAKWPQKYANNLSPRIRAPARKRSSKTGISDGTVAGWVARWGFNHECACTSAAVNLSKGSRVRQRLIKSTHSGETFFQRLPENGPRTSLASSEGAAISHRMSCSRSAVNGAVPLMSMYNMTPRAQMSTSAP
mmetsp:Transcript_7898/g.22738  ORF Transcript_7898/g.22738 Transcript_7898/m.22738 type:complete len:292 (+) Transcript_7898:763-1638(+)